MKKNSKVLSPTYSLEDIEEYYQVDAEKKVKPETKSTSRLNPAIENAVDVKPNLPVLMKKNLNDEYNLIL